jgi:hypothetical protein
MSQNHKPIVKGKSTKRTLCKSARWVVNRIMKGFVFMTVVLATGCGMRDIEHSDLTVEAENINSYVVIWESDHDSILVYKEGKYLKNIPNVYGGNGFLLYYNDKYVGNVGHFKFHFIADGIGYTNIHHTFYNGVMIR